MDETSDQTSHPVKTELSRELSLFHITMMGVGMMIGWGIFVGTGIAIGEAGPGGVLVTFALNGLIALITALSYAELSSAIPRAGGAYNYARISYGKGVSFLAGWIEWFASSVAGGIYSVAFATYTVHFLQGMGILGEVPIPLSLLTKMVAVAVALTFVYINYRGASETGLAGSIMTLGQTLTMGFIGLAGFWIVYQDPSRLNNFHPFLPNGWGKVLVMMGFTYVAFEGFEVIVQTGDEAIDPRQNLPKAILFSLLIVVSTYLAVSFATVVAVRGVGVEAWQWIGRYGPTGFGEAIARLLPYGGILVIVAVVFSSTSALNATIYSATRVSYALGRDRMLPAVFSRIHPKRKIPNIALLATAVLVIGIVVALPAEDVAASADIMFLLLFFLVNIAVIKIRNEYGDELTYGFVMPLFPVLPMFAIAMQIFLAVWLIHMSVVAWVVSGVWLTASFLIFNLYSKTRCEDTVFRIVVLEEEKAEARRPYRIVLPIANPENAIQLVTYAVKIARYHYGEISLLHMVPIPEQTPLSDAERYLDVGHEAFVEASLYVPPDVPVSTSIQYCRSIPRGIVNAIHEQKSDLIILGWRGRSLLQDYVLGSTIDPILEKAPCDSIVIRLGRYRPVSRILVPVAGGYHGHMALRVANMFLEHPDSRITAFHVLRPGNPKQKIEKTIEAMIASEKLPRGRIDVKIVESESVLATISQEAARHELVVIGASPYRFFKQMVFGNLVEEVAKNCETPIMMVKSKRRWIAPVKVLNGISKKRT
ncbi:MAG: amino acid permease [Deltaproteobacteria bacterium]|nr:amino acid permease [Deltaproteobacteria bacterium]